MITQTIQNSTSGASTNFNLGLSAITDLIATWKLDHHLIDPSRHYQRDINYDGQSRLLTAKYEQAVAGHMVPDLTEMCEDLFNSLFQERSTRTPLDFIPILNKRVLMDKEDLNAFVNGTESKYVMVDDPLVKIVLIKWRPGKTSTKHGHPGGGGAIKVLKGSLEEKRFDVRMPNKLTSHSTYHTGGIAYIDDDQALHQVSNPFDSTAISLHAYVKG